jgi:hypothetical protein
MVVTTKNPAMRTPISTPGARRRSRTSSTTKTPDMDNMEVGLTSDSARLEPDTNFRDLAARPQPNEIFGNVLDDAQRFPVEMANDNFPMAFLRTGQYWRNAESAAKDHQDLQCDPGDPGSFIITAGAGHKLIRLPKTFSDSDDTSPRSRSTFKYTAIDPNFSVTAVGVDSSRLALWKKDTPFDQGWECTVDIQAKPKPREKELSPEKRIITQDGHVRRSGSEAILADETADTEFEMIIGTVKVEWKELLKAFVIAETVLLMQTGASYSAFQSSQSVSVDYVAKMMMPIDDDRDGFISFTTVHQCESPFQCAEDFKASQRRYDLSIHDLFHDPKNSPDICLTRDGYWNALGNITFGTIIIQVLVMWDAYVFWNIAPMNMATHTHLRKIRWIGFFVLFMTMLANYGFIILACFYSILSTVEEFHVGFLHTFALLIIDDVAYKFMAARFFRVEHSARPGSAACHAVKFYCRYNEFSWSTCFNTKYAGTFVANIGNRVAMALVAGSPILFLTVVVLGSWFPMFMHHRENGFFHNTTCPGTVTDATSGLWQV